MEQPQQRLERKESVSEAVHASGEGESRAPSWLKWFEYPFHVANPTTKVKLNDACAWSMASVGRGPINQMGGYTGNAILILATLEAGCFNPLTCENSLWLGLKPSSLLTLISAIMGVLGAITMPVVGAIVDHTSYRWHLGAASAFIMVATAGGQIAIGKETWVMVLVFDAIQTFASLVFTTAHFAYLPDLTLNQDDIGHYTSRFGMNQYGVQLFYVTLVIAAGLARGPQENFIASAVQSAQDAAGMAFGLSFITLGYSWAFLFNRRPALSKVPEGSNLLTTGFVQVGKTTRKVWAKYRALRWFMFSLLWSLEAGAGVMVSVAVTYGTVVLRFDGLDIARGSLLIIAGLLVGAFFSKFTVRWWNALNSYRVAMLYFALVLFFTTVFAKGPEDRGIAFGMSYLLGFAVGWTYPSQRVLFCTLTPKGQETEFMGLFVSRDACKRRSIDKLILTVSSTGVHGTDSWMASSTHHHDHEREQRRSSVQLFCPRRVLSRSSHLYLAHGQLSGCDRLCGP